MSRRVNFRDSPPSGSGSRYTSDSGLGSLSDQSGRAAHHDAQKQWNDLGALQEAYRALFASKEQWKRRAAELDGDASQSRKAAKETEAKWRGLCDRNEQLEEEKAKLFRDRKDLLEHKKDLLEKNEELRAAIAKANATIEELRRNSPPYMAGANPEAAAHAPPSRRGSQKKRLSQRFEAKEPDRADAAAPSPSPPSSSSAKTARARRASYVEPFGPPAAAAPPPPAARAHYAGFAEGPHYAPAFAQPEKPAFSAVPRSVSTRPTVSVLTADPDYYADPGGYMEDGVYHPYPLPGEARRGHRGKHTR